MGTPDAPLNPDHEMDARKRSWGLEATGKLPAGFTAEHYPLTADEQRELHRCRLAGLLADDPNIYVALVHQGKAPRRWLDRRLQEIGYR